MTVEIEAKYKVDKDILLSVEQRLKQLNADYLDEFIQKDLFFDRPDRSLLHNDSGLRIRSESSSQQMRVLMCFKGPRQKGDFKRREEIEFAVENLELARAFLQALGYENILTVSKKRRMWQLDKCLVCLDEVDRLGCFIEIEGPAEQEIAQVTEDLALLTNRHITKSYARMVAELLH